MSDIAKLAYKDASTPKEELDILLTLQVPKQVYLQKLIEAIQMRRMMFYDPTLAETTISEIQTIIQKITAEQAKTQVSTNRMSFFARSAQATDRNPEPESKPKPRE